MTTRAYVLLLDVIGSSELENRQQATEKIQTAQQTVNDLFREDWLAPLETTRGDETAAVLPAASSVYDVIAKLGDLVHPLSLRAVVEHGELVAGLDTRRASIIDGPAFHAADKTMDSLKSGPAICHFHTGFDDLDRPLTALGNLLLSQLADMTELQRTIFRLYQEKRKQKDVAGQIGRSQQQVSTALQSIRWQLLEDAEKAMRRLLAEVDRRYAGRADE